jgi:Flp pilus assembly protein TadD
MAVGIQMIRARVLALMFASAGVALAAMPSVALAVAVPVYAESPADSLARNVRILANSPRDFNALVGAGKAALMLGDGQSAAGFFGLAEEIYPTHAIPKAGMAAALVMTGDPNEALTYFARAQQLGASVASFGCDRGLAFDLLGQQAAAQTDYRAALAGQDRDEARRRLALSLAISGDKALALSTLDPLLARRDAGAVRVRALVLALSGDTEAAKRTLDARMPGSSAMMGPFFRRLPTLSIVEKAAAVHLGIFPGNGATTASAPDQLATSQAPITQTALREDRLASIEQILARTELDSNQTSISRYATPTPARAAARQAPPVQLASISRPKVEMASSRSVGIETQRVPSNPGGKKIWLQLASGAAPTELPNQFNRIRSRQPSLFSGISPYVADADSRARLVIGPFHSEEDARLFADALASVRVDSRRWVSQPGQVVRKLRTQ